MKLKAKKMTGSPVEATALRLRKAQHKNPRKVNKWVKNDYSINKKPSTSHKQCIIRGYLNLKILYSKKIIFLMKIISGILCLCEATDPLNFAETLKCHEATLLKRGVVIDEAEMNTALSDVQDTQHFKFIHFLKIFNYLCIFF